MNNIHITTKVMIINAHIDYLGGTSPLHASAYMTLFSRDRNPRFERERKHQSSSSYLRSMRSMRQTQSTRFLLTQKLYLFPLYCSPGLTTTNMVRGGSG